MYILVGKMEDTVVSGKILLMKEPTLAFNFCPSTEAACIVVSNLLVSSKSSISSPPSPTSSSVPSLPFPLSTVLRPLLCYASPYSPPLISLHPNYLLL